MLLHDPSAVYFLAFLGWATGYDRSSFMRTSNPTLMEWQAALGLLVTLVWLYIEVSGCWPSCGAID